MLIQKERYAIVIDHFKMHGSIMHGWSIVLPKTPYFFYCYLFKQPRAENYGVDAFTVNGFRGWKDGCELIDAHSNGIDHNKSRRAYEDFKNQRQSVAHVMNRGGKKEEEEYKGRMLIILGVIRFLLL
jgi:hypothetical protein